MNGIGNMEIQMVERNLKFRCDRVARKLLCFNKTYSTKQSTVVLENKTFQNKYINSKVDSENRFKNYKSIKNHL